VICETSHAQAADLLVLWLWEHQPILLKGRFRFSSGSLSNRNRQEACFDLQFMPRRALQGLQRNAPGNEIILAENETSEPVPWLANVADRVLEWTADLDAFVQATESDLPGTRKAFGTALRVFYDSTLSANARQLSDDISVIAEAFTRGSEALELKRWFLRSLESGLSLTNDAERLLRILMIDDQAAESFSSVDDASRIAKNLIGRQFDAAVHIANDLTQRLSHGAESFFGVFATELELNRTASISQLPAAVLERCVKTRPSLLQIAETWCSGESSVMAIARLTEDTSAVSDSLLADSIGAFLAGYSCKPLPSSALAHLHRLIAPLLDRLQSDAIPNTQRQLIQPLLAGHSTGVANWFQTHDFGFKTFVTVANAVTPSPEWNRISIERWNQSIADSVPKDWQTPHGLNAAAFLFALILGDEPAAANAQLLPAIFEPIHAAAETETLPDRAWSLLQPFVPVLSKYRNWDICERLRRAVVHRWVENSWPVEPLLTATIHGDAFKRIVEYCADSSDARELLRQMGVAVQQRPGTVTERQAWLLRRAHVA